MTDLSVAVRIAAQEEVSAAADRATRGLQGLSSEGQKATGVFSALGSGLSMGVGFAAAQAGFTGITSAVGGFISAASGFESKLSAIAAVSGGAGGKMQELSRLALQLGKDTSFSAAEAANGIEELIKAGVSVETIIGGGASAALSLAAAGAIGVGEAAEIASNAVNAFGQEAQAFAGGPGAFLSRAADLIAGAANASAIDVNEFKFSLSAAGAVAATVGLPLEDLTTAIAMLGNAGIKGSDAGTSLKVMLMNLQPSTKAQLAEFERLGIATINSSEAFTQLKAALMETAEGQKAYDKMAKDGTLTAENLWKAADRLSLSAVSGTTSFERWIATSGNLGNSFFDATGKVKSMEEIAGVLSVAMKDLTKQEQLASLEILFGADAVRAAAVIAEQGAAGYAKLNAEINKTTAADVAKTRLDNLKGSIDQFTGSAETLAIMLASKVLPSLRGLVDFGTSGLNALITGVEMLPSLGQAISDVFNGGEATGMDWQTFQEAFGRDLSLAILAGVATAGAAFATIGEVFAGSWNPNESTEPLIRALGQVATFVRDGVLPAIRGFADGIILAGGQMADQFAPTLTIVSNTFQTLIGFAGQIISSLLSMGEGVSATDTYFNVAVATWSIASTVLGTIATVVNTVVVGLASLTDFVSSNVAAQTALVGVLGAVATNYALTTAAAIAGGIATQGVAVAMGVFRVGMLAVNAVMAANPIGLLITVIGGLVAAFIYAYNTSEEFRDTVDAVWEAVKVGFAAAVEYIKIGISAMIALWMALPGSWSEAWAMVQAAGQAGVDLLVAALQAGWNLILVGVSSLWTMMQGAMAAGWSVVTGLWQTALDGISAYFQSVLDMLFTKETQAKFAILMATLQAVWAAVTTLFTTTLTGIVTLVIAKWTEISTATTQAWNAVTQFLSTWWTAAVTLFTNSINLVVALFRPAWTLVQTETTTIWTSITKVITDTWTIIQTTVDTALNEVWRLVTTKGQEIVAGVGSWLGSIATSFTTQVEVWKKAGSDMATALMDSIKGIINSAAQGIIDTLTSTATRALEAVRGVLPGNGRGGSSGNAKWDQIAREEGVDPALLRSLIDQESNGNQNARSSRGAIGLTQLMPGTAAGLGVDPNDPDQNVRGGARYLRQMMDMYGGDVNRALVAYNAGPGGGIPDESRAYAQRVIAGMGNYQRAGAISNLNLTQGQTVWGQQAGMSMEEAAAACGPYAAYQFAAAVGRPPTKEEAAQIARQSGWSIAGMGGTGNFMTLLGRYGVNAVRDATPTDMEASSAVMAGNPVAFSTARHYFAAQGYDPSTGKYDLGSTGSVMSAYGGSQFMSFEEIARVGGGMQDLITLAGQMGVALTGAGQQGGAAFQGLLISATTLADGSTVAITQMGNQIMATITDSSGNVVAKYGEMAESLTTSSNAVAQATTTSFDMMSQGSLQSVTALGDGVLTTFSDMNGNTIATVTDANGQIQSQYATLSNGVSFSLEDMNVKSTSSVDAMTGNITTRMTDAAGNVVTTVTDMSGQVVSQTVTANDQVVANTISATDQVIANTVSRGTRLVEEVTNHLGITTERYQEANGSIVTIVTDQNGKVLADYTTTQEEIQRGVEGAGDTLIATTTDQQGRVVEIYRDATGEMTTLVIDSSGKIVDEFRGVQKSATDAADQGIKKYAQAAGDIPEVDLGDTARQFGDVASAAKEAQKSVAKYIGELKELPDGKFGGSLNSRKGRATGGPVVAGGEYWVGESEPEIFRPSVPGTILTASQYRNRSAIMGVQQSSDDGPRTIQFHQEIHQVNDGAEIQRYTERAIRKIATDWEFDF